MVDALEARNAHLEAEARVVRERTVALEHDVAQAHALAAAARFGAEGGSAASPASASASLSRLNAALSRVATLQARVSELEAILAGAGVPPTAPPSDAAAHGDLSALGHSSLVLEGNPLFLAEGSDEDALVAAAAAGRAAVRRWMEGDGEDAAVMARLGLLVAERDGLRKSVRDAREAAREKETQIDRLRSALARQAGVAGDRDAGAEARLREEVAEAQAALAAMQAEVLRAERRVETERERRARAEREVERERERRLWAEQEAERERARERESGRGREREGGEGASGVESERQAEREREREGEDAEESGIEQVSRGLQEMTVLERAEQGAREATGEETGGRDGAGASLSTSLGSVGTARSESTWSGSGRAGTHRGVPPLPPRLMLGGSGRGSPGGTDEEAEEEGAMDAVRAQVMRVVEEGVRTPRYSGAERGEEEARAPQRPDERTADTRAVSPPLTREASGGLIWRALGGGGPDDEAGEASTDTRAVSPPLPGEALLETAAATRAVSPPPFSPATLAGDDGDGDGAPGPSNPRRRFHSDSTDAGIELWVAGGGGGAWGRERGVERASGVPPLRDTPAASSAATMSVTPRGGWGPGDGGAGERRGEEREHAGTGVAGGAGVPVFEAQMRLAERPGGVAGEEPRQALPGGEQGEEGRGEWREGGGGGRARRWGERRVPSAALLEMEAAREARRQGRVVVMRGGGDDDLLSGGPLSESDALRLSLRG